MHSEKREYHYQMSYLKKQRVPHKPGSRAKSSESFSQAYPLPLELRSDLGQLHQMLESTPTSDRMLSLVDLGTICYYSLGLFRYEPTDDYKVHRVAPSPRCLYATQIYRVVVEDAQLEPGIYHYDCLSHRLVRVEISTGILPEFASNGWLISSRRLNIEILYGPFSRRLALLEAGHIVEQVSIVSARLGHPVDVHVLPELTNQPFISSQEDCLFYLSERHEYEQRTQAPEHSIDLEVCFARRHSGHGTFGILPEIRPIVRPALERLSRYGQGERPGLSLDSYVDLETYLFVIHSDEVPRGIYHCASTDDGALRFFAPLPQASIEALFSYPGFAIQNSAAVWICTGSLKALESMPRGYEVLQAAVASRAQRVALTAASLNLFARPSVSLHEPVIDQLLQLTFSEHSALYSVIFGCDREAGLPLKLSIF